MRPSSQCFHISPPQVVLRFELCASLKLMPFEQLDPHLRELCLLLREDSHAGRRLRCDQRGVRTHDHRSTLTAPGRRALQPSTPFVAPCSLAPRDCAPEDGKGLSGLPNIQSFSWPAMTSFGCIAA